VILSLNGGRYDSQKNGNVDGSAGWVSELVGNQGSLADRSEPEDL